MTDRVLLMLASLAAALLVLSAARGHRLMPVWGETFSIDAADSEAGAELARRRIAAITDFIERLQN